MRIYAVIPINQIEKGNHKEKKQAKNIKGHKKETGKAH